MPPFKYAHTRPSKSSSAMTDLSRTDRLQPGRGCTSQTSQHLHNPERAIQRFTVAGAEALRCGVFPAASIRLLRVADLTLCGMSPPDRGCIRQPLPRRTRMVTSTHGPRSDSTSKKAHNRTVRILGASISSVNSIAREYAHHLPAAAADLIRSDRLRADRGRMHQPS
jgi:hypothetical protein